MAWFMAMPALAETLSLGALLVLSESIYNLLCLAGAFYLIYLTWIRRCF